MSGDITFQRRNIVSSNAPQVQADTGAAQVSADISNSLYNIGLDIRQKADNLYKIDFRTQAIRGVEEISSKYPSDPDGMAKELQSYKKGLFQNIPSRLRGEFEGDYLTLSQDKLNKALINKRKNIDSELQFKTLGLYSDIVNNASRNVEDLFLNDGLSQEEVLLKTESTLKSLSKDLISIDNLFNQQGADGLPIFTPEQRYKKIEEAKEYIFSKASSSWVNSQPDKLAAYNSWINNEVALIIPDENGKPVSISLRDSLSPALQTKVDSEVIKNIKTELSIQNKILSNNEKIENKIKDQNANSLYDLAFTDSLSPEMVQRYKNSLKPSDYQNLSKMSIESNPVTNGRVFGELFYKASTGQDVEGQIANARFNNKQISNEDFKYLVNFNSQQRGEGVIDAISFGRKTIAQGLGAESSDFGLPNAAALANANVEYEVQIKEFQQKEKRKPTLKEVNQISREIISSYQLLKATELIQAAPKPQGMSYEEINNFDINVYNSVLTRLKDSFNKKYNGDIEKIKNDPVYRSERRKLEGLKRFIEPQSQEVKK